MAKILASADAMGMKQPAVGKVLDVTQPQVSRWKTGKGYPKPMHLVLWAEHAKISLAYLADDRLHDPDAVAGDPGILAAMPVRQRLLWNLLLLVDKDKLGQVYAYLVDLIGESGPGTGTHGAFATVLGKSASQGDDKSPSTARESTARKKTPPADVGPAGGGKGAQ